MLSGETQRRVSIPERRNENINLINISFPRVGIEPKTSPVPTLCDPAPPLFYYTTLASIMYYAIGPLN